jgi:hypothetical protein
MTPGSDATQHFVEKWYRREPEMRIAAAFCARADAPPATGEPRLRFEAWGALLHELREALFELPDAGVAAAKRGWWAEELQLIGAGRARHPLGQALAEFEEAKQAPWTGLSLAFVGGGGEPRGADTGAALAALQPLAQATNAVERALFAARDPAESGASALAVHWLLQRLPCGLAEEDGARVPMHLLARHGLTAAALASAPDALLRDWAGELRAALPDSAEGAFLRRARTRFDRARLQRLQGRGGQGGFDDPAAPGTLWRAWRAARGR